MIKINDKFEPLLLPNDKVRYVVITGGRGSAKSFSVATYLSLLTYESGHTILFTRYTMTSAFLSIIPEFLEKIELLGITKDFKITKNEIVNTRNGNRILFRGLSTSNGDNTASLKSLQGISVWVLDESEELHSEKKFDTIDLSVREKKVSNKVVLVMNPSTKSHWIYKRFFESKGVNPGFNGVKNNTLYIHTSYLDNIANLSTSFLDQVNEMKIKRPGKYKHQVLGGWLDKAEGVVFDNWKIGNFPAYLPTIAGADFGFSNDPTTLVEVAIDKKHKKIYFKEHLYHTKLTTSDIYTMFNTSVGKKLIIGDSAEPRLIQELKSKGLNIKGVKKGKDSIITGISILQDWDLVIDPKSYNIIKELNNYVWMDKKSNTPVDKFNHLIDAMRYAVYHQLHMKRTGTYSIY